MIFTCRAIKSYVDGALGSYGAWLLSPYSDRQDNFMGKILVRSPSSIPQQTYASNMDYSSVSMP